MRSRKLLSIFLIAAMILSVSVPASLAMEGAAVQANGDITLLNSSSISGNVILNGGTLSGQEWTAPVTGTVYTASGAVVANKNIASAEYEGAPAQETFPEFTKFPGAETFAGCTYSDGTKDFTVGWWGSDASSGYTLSENAYFSSLTVNSDLEFNLSPAKNTVLILRVGTLNLYGNLNITGEGSVVIYADAVAAGRNNRINAQGDAARLMIILGGENAALTNFNTVRANVAIPGGSLDVSNVKLLGNVYAANDVSIRNDSRIDGLVSAPASSTVIGDSAGIKGRLVTQELSMTGSAFINYGPDCDIADGLWNKVTANKDPEEPQNPDPVIPEGQKIKVSVLLPKKMSVRLENGTVLKSGDTFETVIGQTIRFQMCSNDWENDFYDDNGSGIAGTVVYHFKVADSYTEKGYDAESHTLTVPKGDPVLRTDTNNFFMAYRYHFVKGDYNKQTGIAQVVNTPLESLSVNLPLGSTIRSGAYASYQLLTTENVFIEQAEDETISYRDYYWDY